MAKEKCKECSITLSDYEKDEYDDLCLECYRELNNQDKSQQLFVNVRLKNKKYFTRIVQK